MSMNVQPQNRVPYFFFGMLMYFVANPFKKLFGQVVCCGMCASRKPTKAPVTVKSVDRKGKTNGTKK